MVNNNLFENEILENRKKNVFTCYSENIAKVKYNTWS